MCKEQSELLPDHVEEWAMKLIQGLASGGKMTGSSGYSWDTVGYKEESLEGGSGDS